jgi:hypothetical protein
MVVAQQPEQSKPAQSGMVVAQQQTDEATPAANQPAPVPSGLFNQNSAGAPSARCNIPVCARSHRSFRASDCTYQPNEGGPRRFCTVSGGERLPKASQQARSPNEQKPNGEESTQVTAHEAQGAANAKCNVAACRGYSSFRASDCTYQPFGGGPRRACGRPDDKTAGKPGRGPDDERTAGKPSRGNDDERTAGRPGRERDAPGGFFFGGRRAESSGDSHDRDGPPPRPAPDNFFGRPLFDWGHDGW